MLRPAWFWKTRVFREQVCVVNEPLHQPNTGLPNCRHIFCRLKTLLYGFVNLFISRIEWNVSFDAYTLKYGGILPYKLSYQNTVRIFIYKWNLYTDFIQIVHKLNFKLYKNWKNKQVSLIWVTFRNSTGFQNISNQSSSKHACSRAHVFHWHSCRCRLHGA